MNAQPMGFYPPSSLVRDAQRRGVEVRPPHVNRSEAECRSRTARCGSASATSTRSARQKRVGGRSRQPYARRRRSRAPRLGEAGRARGARRRGRVRRVGRRGASCSGGSASPPRGEAVGGGNRQLALPLEPTAEIPELPAQTPWEQMLADYKHTSLSVGVHPLQLLRPHLPAGVATSAELPETPHGTRIEVAGMAVARQRPATANGIVFMLLEDEHGQANLIIPPNGLRGAPRDRPRRAAAPRARQARASRPQRERARRGRRVTRPARAPSGERGGGDALPAARAPLRPSLNLGGT